MPRTRATNVSAAQWSPNGGAMGQSDLTQAGAYGFGDNVFSTADPAPAPAEGRLQEPAGDAGERARRSIRRSPTPSRRR